MPQDTIAPQKSFDLEFNFEKANSKFENKDVILLISVLKEMISSKNPPQATVHAKLVEKLLNLKKKPTSIFILAAGLLKRWNYWEMVRELTDTQLEQLLQDIPENISEEKLSIKLAERFSPVAQKLEEELLTKLKELLKSVNLLNVTFAKWDERFNFKNIEDLKPRTTTISAVDLEITKEEFLKNKSSLLNKAKKRMIHAQPNLSTIDFEKLDKICCYNYMFEEAPYFNTLHDAQILHRGKKPNALNSIFIGRDDLDWQAFSFKESDKKNHVVLKRSNSTPIKKDEYHSLADRRHKFFLPTKITTKPKETKHVLHPAFQSTEEKHSVMTPTTDKNMKTLYEFFSKAPPSEQIYLAKKKIEEATALLQLS